MLTPGKNFFEYRIRSRLGQRGFGIAYLAEDTLRHRPVAIMAVDETEQKDPVAFKRFLREARLVGGLHHPNVVVVHAVKKVGATVYLVMEHPEGGSLRSLLEQSGRLQIGEVIRLGYELSAGLAAVHAQGVVHGNLKPENILLTGDSRAKIAALDPSKIDLTAEGSQLRTSTYMSPEQIRGDNIDFRSDIYQLGTVLHKMLWGCHYLDVDALWAKTTIHADRNVMSQQAGFVELLFVATCSGEPACLAQPRPDAEDWLIELLASMLADDPGARPASNELSQIFKAYLDRSEQDRCLEESIPPELVVLAGAYPCPQCGCRIRKKTRTCPYCGLRFPTSSTGLQIDFLHGRSEAINPTNLFRLELLACLGKGSVNAIAISPDERRVALARDTGLAIYDAFNGCRQWYVLREGIRSLAFSPNSRTLAVAVEDERIQFWDVENGFVTGTVSLDSGPHAEIAGIQFSPDARSIVVESKVGRNQAVHLLELPAGRHLWTTVAGYMPIRIVAFSPDSSLIAVAYKSDLRFWHISEDRPREPITLKAPILAMAFSADGSSLALGYEGKGIEVISLPDLASCVRLETKGFFPYPDTLAFSPDGAIVAGTHGSNLALWRPSDGRRIAQIEIDDEWGWRSCRQLQFSQDGSRLLIGSTKPSIARYQVPNLIDYHKPVHFEADRESFGSFRVSGFALSSDFSRLAYATASSIVRVTPLTPDPHVQDLDVGGFFVHRLALDGKGSTLAVQTSTQEVVWCRLEDGLTATWHTGRIEDAALLARLKSEAAAKREDLNDDSPSAGFGVLRVSQDGRLVAAAGGATFGHVSVWDVVSARSLLCIEVPTAVTEVVFSPDGSQLACAEHGSLVDSPTADAPARVSLWDIRQRKLLRAWQTEIVGEASLAFSPDGRRLAAVVSTCHHRADHHTFWAEMRMWDAAEGRLLCSVPYQQNSNGMRSVSFSPNGEFYAITGVLENGDCALIFRVADHVRVGAISGAGILCEFNSDWTLLVNDRGTRPQLWGIL